MLLNALANVILPWTLTPGPSRGTQANINTDAHLDRVWVFRSKLQCSGQLSAFYCAQTSISEPTASFYTTVQEEEKTVLNLKCFMVEYRSREEVLFISGKLQLCLYTKTWIRADHCICGIGCVYFWAFILDFLLIIFTIDNFIQSVM